MSEATRDKILTVSIELMAVKGFNNTGIAEILARAGVPKGSFYYYFNSKDTLGFAIIDHYGQQLTEGLASVLSTGKGLPLERLRAYFEGALGYFQQDFTLCNCLLGNLGQELAMQNEPFRQAIFKHYQAIEALLAKCLKEAKAAKQLAASADEQSLARMFFSSWEGCLVRAKLAGSPAPLRELISLYFDQILIP
ncbi:MAG TPA: TetR family transcriptional regulator C-terminal domain-containing protein [Cellvibrionaceae bacterium]